jgi:hypothetical protein
MTCYLAAGCYASHHARVLSLFLPGAFLQHVVIWGHLQSNSNQKQLGNFEKLSDGLNTTCMGRMRSRCDGTVGAAQRYCSSIAFCSLQQLIVATALLR